ncbi:MHO_1580 family protein [Candidatus Mycoplasma mahonii]|uniref:MHO_1580 family protein n=1 Tax=Candidatus Mycoplasma mahonii TaxID=3004105 RepID=UPI0026F0ADE9|nr:hypothetical protein [Candidatus Mycoplasma mahonii]WKX02685.1 hypothetical protein O3I44_01250 [Candidatus Mycoplasma mahonii]
MNNTAKGIFHSPSLNRWNNAHDPLSHGKIKIVRNLNADSFNIEYEKFGVGYDNFYPFANMGLNKSGQESFDLREIGRNPSNGPYIKVHRTVFNNPKLYDVGTMTLGFNIGGTLVDPQNNFILSRYIFNPQFLEVPKHINSTFDKIIHFKTIKTIILQKHNKYKYTKSNNFNPIDVDDVDVSYTYNHTYLVPTELNRMSTNTTPFLIYMSNDEDIETTHDQLIKAEEITSTGLGKSSMRTIFSYGGNDSIMPANGKRANLIGKTTIIDKSYYDYEIGKTIVGNEQNALYGEQVPFSFRGNYTRNLKINLNCTFKGLTISLSKTIDQPILDPSDGMVKLQVEETVKDDQKLFILKQNGIDAIRNNNLTLEGIARISYYDA